MVFDADSITSLVVFDADSMATLVVFVAVPIASLVAIAAFLESSDNFLLVAFNFSLRVSSEVSCDILLASSL